MRTISAALAALVLALGGCGGSDDDTQLTVSAAASLKTALTELRRGVRRRDGALLVRRLGRAGRADPPGRQARRVRLGQHEAARRSSTARGWSRSRSSFAPTELVLAVPADGTDVASLDDLEQPGTTLAIGSESRARRLLHAQGARRAAGSPRSTQILANVRSNEPDVGGRRRQGHAGRGRRRLRLRHRRRATDGKLKAIELPADLKPKVAYGVAVVKGAKHPEQAKAFVDGLLDGAGQRGARRGRLPAAAGP